MQGWELGIDWGGSTLGREKTRRRRTYWRGLREDELGKNDLEDYVGGERELRERTTKRIGEEGRVSEDRGKRSEGREG